MKFLYEHLFEPKGPYSFFWTASAYSFSWDFDGNRAYVALPAEDNFTFIVLENADNGVLARFYGSDSNLDAIPLIERIFDFGADLSEFYNIIKDDPLLSIVYSKLWGIHLRSTASIWEAGLIGICQQNASFLNGWKMLYNLRKILGKEITLEGHKFFTYPTPQDVLAKKDLLKKTKVGYRADTILRLARTILNGGDWREVKGIGKYTRALIEILYHRNYRIFPVDKWFRRIMPYFYEQKISEWSEKQVIKFAEKKWGKWMGLASMLITIVTAAEPLTKIFKIPINPLPNKPAPLTLWKFM